jgi:polyisoprenoid-binding protein YceI
MAVMTPAEVTSDRLDIPEPGRYRISPAQSTVTIRTRHFFGLGAVRATLALRDGRIVVTDPPQASTVQARFAVPSFQSGNETRDAAVLSPKLLDAEAFPSLAFTSTELVEEQGQWSLRGELEVRGVTRLVEARIGALAVDDAGPTLRASAQVSIDRYDFGITAYRGLAARRLTVGLAVIAHREES